MTTPTPADSPLDQVIPRALLKDLHVQGYEFSKGDTIRDALEELLRDLPSLMLVLNPGGKQMPGQGRIATLILTHLPAYVEEQGSTIDPNVVNVSEIYSRCQLVLDRLNSS